MIKQVTLIILDLMMTAKSLHYTEADLRTVILTMIQGMLGRLLEKLRIQRNRTK